MKFFVVTTPTGEEITVEADSWDAEGGLLVLKKGADSVAVFVHWCHFVTGAR
jgi:hypothetical protein